MENKQFQDLLYHIKNNGSIAICGTPMSFEQVETVRLTIIKSHNRMVDYYNEGVRTKIMKKPVPPALSKIDSKQIKETEKFVKKCKAIISDETAWPIFEHVPVDKRNQFLEKIKKLKETKDSVVYIFLKTII